MDRHVAQPISAMSPRSLLISRRVIRDARFVASRCILRVIDDAERQLDHFAELLVRRGITVRRPDPVEQSIPVKTPDWEAACGHATACPETCFW